ncbi:MAG: hypothetical protein AAFP90_04975 [Planctomycetota bacterium]
MQDDQIERLMECVIDRPLTPQEMRTLSRHLDAQPGQWRDLAVRLLEEKLWRDLMSGDQMLLDVDSTPAATIALPGASAENLPSTHPRPIGWTSYAGWAIAAAAAVCMIIWNPLGGWIDSTRDQPNQTKLQIVQKDNSTGSILAVDQTAVSPRQNPGLATGPNGVDLDAIDPSAADAIAMDLNAGNDDAIASAAQLVRLQFPGVENNVQYVTVPGVEAESFYAPLHYLDHGQFASTVSAIENKRVLVQTRDGNQLIETQQYLPIQLDDGRRGVLPIQRVQWRPPTHW